MTQDYQFYDSGRLVGGGRVDIRKITHTLETSRGQDRNVINVWFFSAGPRPSLLVMESQQGVCYTACAYGSQ